MAVHATGPARSSSRVFASFLTVRVVAESQARSQVLAGKSRLFGFAGGYLSPFGAERDSRFSVTRHDAQHTHPCFQITSSDENVIIAVMTY